MPKKKSTETQAEQSKRFIETVEKLVKDGDLDQEKADKGLDAVIISTPIEDDEKLSGLSDGIAVRVSKSGV